MKKNTLEYPREESYYKGKIIAIKYFYFESQALIYLARLKEQGINAFISNTNAITTFPLGDGGIGLHIREIDHDKSIPIIKELDLNNLNEPNISFHDADLEDIAYEKALRTPKNKIDPILLLFLLICGLIIFRALMRAKGFILWGDSF